MSRLLRKAQHLSRANWSRVALLLLAYIIVGHWAACMFFYLAKWQLWNASSGWVDVQAGLTPWIMERCLQFADTQTRYVAALYWALTTMSTVGFGDFVPFTNIERLCVIGLQLLAGVLAGCVFGSIGVALRGFDAGLVPGLREQLAALAEVGRKHKLPPPLARRVLASAEHRARAAQGLATRSVLADLSPSLREAVLASTDAAAVVDAHPALRATPRPFRAALVGALRVQTHLPGELIAAAGEAGCQLAFVLEGRVRVGGAGGGADAPAPPAPAPGCPSPAPHATRGGRQLTTGALVGGDEALCEGYRTQRATAVGYVTLLALPRAQLRALLAAWPEVAAAAASRAAERAAPRGRCAQPPRPRAPSILDCPSPAMVAVARGLTAAPPHGSRAAALLALAAAAATPPPRAHTHAHAHAHAPSPTPPRIKVLHLTPRFTDGATPRPAPLAVAEAAPAPAALPPLAADFDGFSARLRELLAAQGAAGAAAVGKLGGIAKAERALLAAARAL